MPASRTRHLLRGHVKMEHLVIFPFLFHLPEAVVKLEGGPLQTWQLNAGRHKAESLAEINTLYK